MSSRTIIPSFFPRAASERPPSDMVVQTRTGELVRWDEETCEVQTVMKLLPPKEEGR